MLILLHVKPGLIFEMTTKKVLICYSNPEGREDTLRMDQFDAHFPMGTRGSSKKRGISTGFGSKLILF